MASDTSRSSSLELHESSIPPLRIIKRSQTVARCTPTRENVGRRRRASCSTNSTDSSIGSPPVGFDGPLTIRKKRQGRSSVLTDHLDDTHFDVSSAVGMEYIENRDDEDHRDIEDPDVTPKAKRGVARTISAGAFLKSELYQRSSEIDATRYSVRGDRFKNVKPPTAGQYDRLGLYNPPRGSPIIPERRPSKSKNFFLRAIAGQGNKETKPQSKPPRVVDSSEPRNTLVRKLSRKRPSQRKENISSESSTASTYFYKRSFSDITDVDMMSHLSSTQGSCHSGSPSLSSSANTRVIDQAGESYVLSPQIIITPEATIVDTGSCFLWVAIEIRGELRKADGCGADHESPLRSPDGSTPLLDLRQYGKLYAMRISLDLGPLCLLSEIFGDLHESKIIRAGEAQLILVKIHFNESAPRRHARELSSDDLMHEIQYDLGETLAEYLAVRLHYKHSGFPVHENAGPGAEGTISHTTRLFTEANAIIRRHNSQSTWSPRTSQTLTTSIAPSPLIEIIERLLPSEEARDAIRKISLERSRPHSVGRLPNIDVSSEETVKPSSTNITARVDTAIAASLISPATVASPIDPFARPPSIYIPPDRQAEDAIDPARKIWTEMRRHSRGDHRRHARTSISADHFLEQKHSSSRQSSGESSVDTIQSAKTDIDRERDRIRDVALKNKRSMGAETLRSIAPSINGSGHGSVRQQKVGALSGLGLGAGRSWWGPPWW